MSKKIHISLIKEIRKESQPKRADVDKWIKASLLKKYENISINITVVSKEKSASLNLAYRNKNNPTNVISLEYPGLSANTNPSLMGDLILCHDIIMGEAQEQNKSPISHYAHMIIHGMLHLQGLDHQNDLEAKIMEDHEISIMSQFNFNNPYILLK